MTQGGSSNTKSVVIISLVAVSIVVILYILYNAFGPKKRQQIAEDKKQAQEDALAEANAQIEQSATVNVSGTDLGSVASETSPSSYFG